MTVLSYKLANMLLRKYTYFHHNYFSFHGSAHKNSAVLDYSRVLLISLSSSNVYLQRLHSAISWTAWPFKIEVTNGLETLETDYQSALHNVPEGRGSRLNRGGSLKSGIHASHLSVLPCFIRYAIKKCKIRSSDLNQYTLQC
jgi:hypothetical protein